MLSACRLIADTEPLADLPLPRHLFLLISGRLALSDVKSDVAPKTTRQPSAAKSL